jgi:predicted nucleic acid-binding protein
LIALVDTNILVDIWQRDPVWALWSVSELEAQAQLHELAINPVIYAELSAAYQSAAALDQELEAFRIKMMEMPRQALYLAGQAFVQYRRRGGVRTGVLADFFIGAHAAVERCPLITRDPSRYSAYFSGLRLITPKRKA